MKPCNVEIQSAAFGRFYCGDTIQGGIRLCSACTAKLRDERKDPVKVGKLSIESEDLSSFPNEKRDFENLDTRLYLALKKLREAVFAEHPEWVANSAVEPEWDAAYKVMRDFEDSHGPMPEFAIARNFGLELVPGTQLFTKNGRRSGNGWLIKVGQRDTGREIFTVYTVLTDAGSSMVMTEQELETQFEVGDWICTLDRIAKDFDRHGLLKAMGSC